VGGIGVHEESECLFLKEDVVVPYSTDEEAAYGNCLQLAQLARVHA
jgi:hypothetical protein